MTGHPATLLAVAHGTVDPNGLAEVRRLLNIVRTKRPELAVELCWLERAEPLYADVLAALDGPVVVVPVLLSTGHHIKIDIGAVVGRRPQTAIAGPLGPDRRITAVVLDRLLAGRGPDFQDVVLFAAGSSDPEAFEQLKVVAEQLQEALHAAEGSGRARVYPRFLTNDDEWYEGLPQGPDVANYLLAPGHFNDQLRAWGSYDLESENVAKPIGAHPQVAAVICDRYDEAARTLEWRDGPAPRP